MRSVRPTPSQAPASGHGRGGEFCLKESGASRLRPGNGNARRSGFSGASPRVRPLSTYRELITEKLLLAAALVAIGVICLIAVFVTSEGIPVMRKVGLLPFLTGLKWDPGAGVFGILPMIIGSLLVTAGALAIGLPLGLAGAIFLAEIAPARAEKLMRPAVELLAGIPSVVYGFFGLAVLVPLLRSHFGGSGFSAFAGSIILSIMILPTVVTIAEDSIRAVPREYKEGSLALGATHWQTIRHVLLPAARSGIIAAAVLGLGRAIGETMAVIMVTGNSPVMPKSFFQPIRTLTGNIVIEMGYAVGDHQRALFATGVVLFTFIMFATAMLSIATRKKD